MKHVTTLTRLAALTALLFTSIGVKAINDALKIRISGNNYSDETVVRFLNGASPGFDGNYDAWKLFSPNPAVPSLYTRIDSVSELSINAYPQLDRQFSFDLYTIINVPGSYTFKSIVLGAFAPGVCISMKDMQTNTWYNMLDSNTYTISMSASTLSSPARFRVYFSAPASINVTDATCSNMMDGMAVLTRIDNHNWGYLLQDASGNVLSNVTGVNETDTIKNLAPGNYTVVEINPYGCGATDLFTIGAPLPVISAFASTDTLVYLNNPAVGFTNNSINAQTYTWDFGDGSPVSYQVSPTHVYASAGTFTVTLTAWEGSCSSISEQMIHVVNASTSTLEIPVLSGLFEVVQQEGNIVVRCKKTGACNTEVRFYSVTGTELQREVMQEEVSFAPHAGGVYLVHLVEGGLVYAAKVICVK